MTIRIFMDFSKETIFTEARSHKKFDGKALSSDEMRAIYELTKLAPTANNSCPLRIVFVNTIESMERLASCALDFNQEKTRTAGSAAILAYDLDFYTRFHYLAPHMKQPVAHASWPVERIERYALANANLQAGFLIAAARALGFDCGPMGGFDVPAVESQFFDEKSWRFSCVILLGHGDPSALHPRAPRLDFDDACRII
jgi:3-hydroxypropanoate dehydrogenase